MATHLPGSQKKLNKPNSQMVGQFDKDIYSKSSIFEKQKSKLLKSGILSKISSQAKIKNPTSNQAKKHSINFDFISNLEGGRKLNGYVPDSQTSKSGVTIATGFDLGQRAEHDLRSLGLNNKLVEKLKPYLGKKSQQAVNLLAKTPLTISKSEANLIDKQVKSAHTTEIVNNYDDAANGKGSFINLPAEAQTVIASVSFQYGSNLEQRTPTFWKHAISQDWVKVKNELLNFGDSYPTRRKKEASLLEKVIK